MSGINIVIKDGIIQAKKGYTFHLVMALYDGNNALLTNLATCCATFQIKDEKDAVVPLVEESNCGSYAGGVQVDTPSLGYVTIDVAPADMALDCGLYYLGLRLWWLPTEEYEVWIVVDGSVVDRMRIVDYVVAPL